jgi:hypothetical protein
MSAQSHAASCWSERSELGDHKKESHVETSPKTAGWWSQYLGFCMFLPYLERRCLWTISAVIIEFWYSRFWIDPYP